MGTSFVFQLWLEIVDAAVEGNEFWVFIFGDFNTVLFSQFHDDVEEVHGIEVELISECDTRINVRAVVVGKNVFDDIHYGLANFFTCHSRFLLLLSTVIQSIYEQ
jgi:hypothetical protein